MKINNYVWENDLSLNDLFLKQKEEIERLTISLQAQEELTINEHIKVEKLSSIIKEVREKVENFDVFKEFTFPLMKKWEEQEVKSSIDYEWNKSIKKPILEILDLLEYLKYKDSDKE